MSDYGVDTDEWQALPWSWAAQLLGDNKNFWVGTASAGGRPHSLPVWGVWDDERHRFMFSCASTSRKAANLSANPQVVVTNDDTVHCVSIEGNAVLVSDDPSKDKWADLYVAKYRTHSPELEKSFVTAHAVFEVTPQRAFGIIEEAEAFSTRATRWVFEG